MGLPAARLAAGTDQRHHRADPANEGRDKKLKIGAGFLTGEIDFKCSTCTAGQKITRGCKEPAPVPVLTIDGEDIYRCPVSLLTPLTVTMCELYGAYRNHFLPVAGGWLDQSAWFIAAIGVLNGEVTEYETRKAKQPK